MKLNFNAGIVEKKEDPIEDNLDSDESLFNDSSDDLIDNFGGEGGISPIDKHKDLLKDLTNFAPYLKDTFNNWLGLVWSEDEGKFIQNPLIKPIMNMRGAAWCAGLLKTYARGNNIITDIGSPEYKNIISDHIAAIWLNLGTREDLGVKEDGDLIRVCNELEHSAELALMGAGDGKYTKFLGTTYSSHSTLSTPQMQQSQPIQVDRKTGMVDKIKEKLVGI